LPIVCCSSTSEGLPQDSERSFQLIKHLPTHLIHGKKGLFYMAGWALARGERVLSMSGKFDKDYGPTPILQYFRPDGPFDADHPQTLIYLDRANFGTAFVQDIDPERALVLGATQRPPTVLSLAEPLQLEPAWLTIRSWYQVSANDKVISPNPAALSPALSWFTPDSGHGFLFQYHTLFGTHATLFLDI